MSNFDRSRALAIALCTLLLAAVAACGGVRLAEAPHVLDPSPDATSPDASTPERTIAHTECPALPEPTEPAPVRCAPDRYEPLPEGGFEGFEGTLAGKAIRAHLWRSDGHVGLDVLPAEGGTMTHYLGDVADCTWLLKGPLGVMQVSGGAAAGDLSWTFRAKGSKSPRALALKPIARDGGLKVVESRESRTILGDAISHENRNWMDELQDGKKAKRYRCDYERKASVVFGAKHAYAERSMSAWGTVGADADKCQQLCEVSETSRTTTVAAGDAFVEGRHDSFCLGQQVGDSSGFHFHVRHADVRSLEQGVTMRREVDVAWLFNQCRPQALPLCSEAGGERCSFAELDVFTNFWDTLADDADRRGLHWSFSNAHGTHWSQGAESAENDCIIPWSTLLAEGYVDPCSPWRDLWEAPK